jgi:hypothetical protein
MGKKGKKVQEPEIFAMVRDDETVVVNLGALREPMSVDELCDLLGFSHNEFVDALDREGNDTYRLVLYESAWTFLEGELYDAVDGTVLLPQASTLAPEQVVEWLGYIFLRVGVGAWKLPAGDFEVPRNPALLKQLADVEKRRPAPMVWFDVVAFGGADAAISELSRRVTALAEIMKKRREKIREHCAWAGSLDRARTLVSLQREHWNYEGRDADPATAAAYGLRHAALADLDTRLEQASRQLRSWAMAKLYWQEKQHAEALLGLFGETDPDAASFASLLRAYAEQPTVLRASQSQELFSQLEAAFALLAASEVADRFLVSHFLPLLRKFCSRRAGQLEHVLASATATEAAQAIAQTWTEAFDLAAKGAAKSLMEPSTLGVLNNLGGGYKTVVGVLSAGMHPRLIAKFLHFVNLGNNDANGTMAGRGAWSVGTALMRYLGMVATPSKASNGMPQLTLAGIQYENLLNLVHDAADPSNAGAKNARNVLGKLRLGDNIMRSPLGIAVSVVIDSVAVLFAIRRDTAEDPVERQLAIGAALLGGVVGNALKIAESRIVREIPLARWAQDSADLARVEKISAGLSATLSLVTMATQTRIIWRKHSRGSLWADCWQDALPAAAAATSALGWIVGLFAAVEGAKAVTLATVAAGLGAASALIGVGAVILAVTNWLSDTGVKPLLDALLDSARQAESKYEMAHLFKAIDASMEAAEDGSAFSEFSSLQPGAPGDGSVSGVPTWNRMAELGFSPREVRLAFGNDRAAQIAMSTVYGEEPGTPQD